ncbi:MAG: butyrate kinase [Candidatus Cloacimonadota bacterium]|nr:MAG: butyrate kinase [Candidatus Cloacimonadota bacterium]
MKYRVLAINPGSTSTKIAVYDDTKEIFTKVLRHDPADLDKFGGMIEQFEYRKDLVLDAMKENNVEITSLEAVVGRGGLVHAVPGGTFAVNDKMKEDLKDPSLWGRIHASNLGAFIASSIADSQNIPSYIVDPVTVDEFDEIARISGIPEIERKSLFHALNLRYTARKVASDLNKKFEETNLVGVHMGGGISVVAINSGRVVDVNNALLGMGPFSPQRAGALPIGDLINMAYSGEWSKKDLQTRLTKTGGLTAYLGTDSGIEVEERIQKGDEKAKLILEAMCYQVAKEIGASASVLSGKVDAVFLTGGLIYGDRIYEEIRKRSAYIAPVLRFPGELEMEALCQGAVRVLKGEEEAKEYK